MINLSVCLIVKNEEHQLPQCLESVKNFADEIIVLDTGSTDKTVEVAQGLGAQVYHFTWCDDFAVARNESLKYVNGKWVLILDADETLNPTIIPFLKVAIQQENHLVINLLRQEIGAKQSPYSLVSRLFRKHPAVYFTHPYHAMIDDSVNELLEKESHWKITSIPQVAIFHTGYQKDAIVTQDKLNRAKKTLEKYLLKHPNDSYTLCKLGALYIESGEEKKGIYLLKKAENDVTASSAILYEIYYHLGIGYTRQNRFDKAILSYFVATRVPILPQLKMGAFNNAGSIHQKKGQWKKAISIYEEMIDLDPHYAPAYYNLGIALKSTGELREAMINYKKAIKLNPEYAEAHQNLGVVLFKMGKIDDSLAAFKQAISLYETTQPEEADRLRQGLQEMGLSLKSPD